MNHQANYLLTVELMKFLHWYNHFVPRLYLIVFDFVFRWKAILYWWQVIIYWYSKIFKYVESSIDCCPLTIFIRFFTLEGWVSLVERSLFLDGFCSRLKFGIYMKPTNFFHICIKIGQKTQKKKLTLLSQHLWMPLANLLTILKRQHEILRGKNYKIILASFKIVKKNTILLEIYNYFISHAISHLEIPIKHSPEILL